MDRGKGIRINQPMNQVQCVDDTESTSQWVNGPCINESRKQSHDQSRFNETATQRVNDDMNAMHPNQSAFASLKQTNGLLIH